MEPIVVIATIALYIAALFAVAAVAGRKADNADFFTGGRRSPWPVATLAMVSAAMSGVTFISVPGSVAISNFSYLQMVIGFIIGYLIIAFVLIPLFYRLKVVSLYEYLDRRFGSNSHLTGASFFLLSRTLMSALRAYTACTVLQLLLFDRYGIPFSVNVTIFMLLVWLYSHRGGVKTIVWTDMLRTFALVGSLVLCIVFILRFEELSLGEAISAISAHPYSKSLFTDDFNDSRHLAKQLLAGVFMVIAMTGLDQEMMQRTLSCRSKGDAQKNMIVAVLLQSVVIVLMLSLGILLYIYLEHSGITMSLGGKFPMSDSSGAAVIAKPDHVFAYVATSGALPAIVGVLFVLGLISSTYSAAGSALTALTTSFTVDILHGRERFNDEQLTHIRHIVGCGTAILLTAIIILFEQLQSDSIINTLYSIAGYTYGPILGMFAFGILSRRSVRDRWMPLVAIAAPLISLLLDLNSERWFAGYDFGFEILIINALLTMTGMFVISRKTDNINQ